MTAALFNTRCEYFFDLFDCERNFSAHIVIHAKSYSIRVSGGGGGGGDDDGGGIDNVYLFIRRALAEKDFLRQSLPPSF